MDHERKHWLTRAVQIGPLKARQRWMETSEQEHKTDQFLPLSRSGSITVLVIELLAVMLLLRLKKTWHSKSLFPCKTVRFGAWSFTSEVKHGMEEKEKKPDGLQIFECSPRWRRDFSSTEVQSWGLSQICSTTKSQDRNNQTITQLQQRSESGKSTFHERGQVRWQPIPNKMERRYNPAPGRNWCL